MVILRGPSTEGSASLRKGSRYLPDIANAEMLRGVYPERGEWAQHDMPKVCFHTLLNTYSVISSPKVSPSDDSIADERS
jgi:hypothetical protein